MAFKYNNKTNETSVECSFIPIPQGNFSYRLQWWVDKEKIFESPMLSERQRSFSIMEKSIKQITVGNKVSLLFKKQYMTETRKLNITVKN